jgi:hypothetical protein
MFCTLNHHRWELGHKRGRRNQFQQSSILPNWTNVSDKPDRPQVLIDAVTAEVGTRPPIYRFRDYTGVG